MRVCRDTTFELTCMPWEIEPPRTTLVIVVKGTFTIVADGACTIADEQDPCGGEVPWDDGDPPSLQLEGDYAVFKPRGEWYLKGTAHAPHGRPATIVPVSVRVGDLRKEMVVWGDRHWKRGLLGAAPSEPKPFTSMPLRWERSYGGPRVAANPVGIGTQAVKTDQGALEPLANIEDPRHPCTAKDAHLPSVGMFPIPSLWRERVSRTGTYDQVWKASRWPFFPRDFDYEFFEQAPRDQRRKEGYWRGDEEIELRGLHPERARLSTRLPGIAARCFVQHKPGHTPGAPPVGQGGGQSAPEPGAAPFEMPEGVLTQVRMNLDTVVVDADRQLVLCQWRGLVDVSDDRLGSVERLFYVHEPIADQHPLAHYADWLRRKLAEEAAEMEMEPLPGVRIPEIVEDPAVRAAEEKTAEVLEQSAAILAAAAGETERAVTATEARRALEEAQIEVPEELVEPDVPEPPEDAAPPSLRRLVAIVRRRLGRGLAGMDLSDAPFRALDLSGVDFSGSILAGADLAGARLRGARFDGAILQRADLSGADLTEASLREADLSEARCARARFERAVLDGAVGTGADLTESRFAAASMRGAYLEGCRMERCDFREAVLDDGSLSGSVLEGSNFTLASLSDASLEGARAAQCIFERCKMPKLRASDRADFTSSLFVLVDAPGAQLQEATLSATNFSGSNLEGADFSDCRAEAANFVRCVLRSACFDHAFLQRSQLMQADLFEASFQKADLSEADLRGAHLFSADLYRAVTRGALLDGAELRRTLLERT